LKTGKKNLLLLLEALVKMLHLFQF